MNDLDLASLMSRSSLFDPAAIDWDAVPHHPLPPAALRTLLYMQDIESHTVIYLRELLSTRAVDDPQMAGFFATWFYEETAHARALGRFLAAAGHAVTPRPRSTRRLGEWIEALGISCIAAAWRDFTAVHMTWGAINELSTLTGYRRLAQLAGHPVLSDLLSLIMRDESRHFHFYFEQAERRLAASATTRRLTRTLVTRFWDPVGIGVQPDSEGRFLASYLFDGPEGRAAAQMIDRTIRRLPGLEDIPLFQAWMERNCAPAAEALHPMPGAAAA